MSHLSMSVLLCLCSVGGLTAQAVDDRVMVDKIRREGLDRSQVMLVFDRFVTVIGPRLTGSPEYKTAAEWSREQLARWGLQDARLEPFDFGRGWTLDGFTLEMIEPRYMPLVGYPEGWSASTAGEIISVPVFVGDMPLDALAGMRDRLKGAIVLTQPLQTQFVREDRAQPTESDTPVTIGAPPMPGQRRSPAEARQFAQSLREAGAAVLLRPSAAEHGTMFVLGRDQGENARPSIIVAAEHYNMLVRMQAAGVPSKLRVNVKTRFLDADRNGYNVLAEIRGTDPAVADEVVMIGAHLDSWHSAPGATDNADGAAVALEAMRILTAVGARPRRTIRVALWGGEEEGLLGSKAYVAKHLAGDANAAARDQFSVYFNVDPGTGPIYGFYLQGQQSAAAILDSWLEPVKDLGVRRNIPQPIGNTDHLSFTAVGLPAFNAVQDYVDYDVRTHHTNMDTFERVRESDLKQAAVVFAAFAYQAAMRDGKFPRPSPSK